MDCTFKHDRTDLISGTEYNDLIKIVEQENSCVGFFSQILF